MSSVQDNERWLSLIACIESNYKLKITREQYRQVGIHVQQAAAAIKSGNRRLPLWKMLEGTNDSVVSERRTVSTECLSLHSRSKILINILRPHDRRSPYFLA